MIFSFLLPLIFNIKYYNVYNFEFATSKLFVAKHIEDQLESF